MHFSKWLGVFVFSCFWTKFHLASADHLLRLGFSRQRQPRVQRWPLPGLPLRIRPYNTRLQFRCTIHTKSMFTLALVYDVRAYFVYRVRTIVVES